MKKKCFLVVIMAIGTPRDLDSGRRDAGIDLNVYLNKSNSLVYLGEKSANIS